MTEQQEKQLKSVFASHPSVKLVYFFGSRAAGKGGPMSDYDFAVYMDGADRGEMPRVKLSLIDEISRLLKTDRLDVVVLNTAEGPELKHSIISEGRLIYEIEPFKALVEPLILNAYFDFRALLKTHHLTKA